MSHGFVWGILSLSLKRTGEKCGFGSVKRPRKGGNNMKEKKEAELLAPAGSFASLKAAVAAGADAVYMGGARFGARAYAQNADQDEMIAAIEYAHLHAAAFI